MRFNHKEKKIMALITTPFSFLIIGYVFLYFFCQPVIRPLTSIYSLIASNSAPNFNDTFRVLYDESKALHGDVVYINEVDWPHVGDQYGEVIIDRIGLNVKLFYGDTLGILDYGAGTFTGAFLPGFDRTVLIPGHTIPFFKALGEVTVGDIVRIPTHYGEYTYKVTNTQVGNYQDESMYDLAQDEKEQLILYTCYPLDGIGFKTERLFIYADKVSGPEIKEGK